MSHPGPHRNIVCSCHNIAENCSLLCSLHTSQSLPEVWRTFWSLTLIICFVIYYFVCLTTPQLLFLCPGHWVAGTYRVTHVRNSEIKPLRPLFFAMLGDIDLIFGIWVYNDKLQIKCTFRTDPMIFGRVMALGLWNLAKYLVVTTLFHWFEILTWFLVWECIIISYRSTLKFIPVEWFLANLQPLGFEIWPNI